ncbi:hypothetical protein p1B20 (plasmid) [Aromatoleum aromaticum EbN1]|uniref:Uncharacterized protein n=1 Tax=Aromatoleum aromaticum (strain DSM 19018 / LMG 30748 / EbN1) TaxID=76114 RepID=Q5NXE9_AROAE|nr:hypothetical protein p1B20 [Aromatoleum aromaticum EbN1]
MLREKRKKIALVMRATLDRCAGWRQRLQSKIRCAFACSASPASSPVAACCATSTHASRNGIISWARAMNSALPSAEPPCSWHRPFSSRRATTERRPLPVIEMVGFVIEASACQLPLVVASKAQRRAWIDSGVIQKTGSETVFIAIPLCRSRQGAKHGLWCDAAIDHQTGHNTAF